MFMPDLWQTAAGLLMGATVAMASAPVQAADNYILGICKVSRTDSGAQIRPAVNGDSYLYSYHSADLPYQGFTFNDNNVKITLVKAPSHGKVVNVESEVSNKFYHYYSESGYYGQDRFVMQVEKNGIKVQIQYLLEVLGEDEPAGNLCDPQYRKISVTTPLLEDARLQAVLRAPNIDANVNVPIADLPGALGQATGSTITLDTNAAGNGWFIDTEKVPGAT